MSTVDDIPLNARSLSYRWNGWDYTLQIDSEHFTLAWRSPSESRSRKIPLRSLKPEFPVEHWVSQGGHRNFYVGTCLLIGAVVVYFSAIRAYVPLLAPAFLVVGLLHFYWFIQRCIPMAKTAIYTSDDQIVTGIPHFRRQTTQRKAFEEALLRMVRRVRDDAA